MQLFFNKCVKISGILARTRLYNRISSAEKGTFQQIEQIFWFKRSQAIACISTRLNNWNAFYYVSIRFLLCFLLYIYMFSSQFFCAYSVLMKENSYIKFRCISKWFWIHLVFLSHLVHWKIKRSFWTYAKRLSWDRTCAPQTRKACTIY